MVGEEEAVETILDNKEVDEVEIVITENETSLTRFANSRIHQNIAREDQKVSIRAVDGKKVGSSTTNRLDEDSLKRCLRKAETIAGHQREDEHFKGLPEEKEGGQKRGVKESYFEDTAEYTPDQRAEKVKEIVEYGRDKKVDRMYGSFETDVISLTVANSNGIRKSKSLTKANLSTTAIADWDNDQGFGRGEFYSADVNDIDHLEVAEKAVQKGLNNLNTQNIEPGEYEVVLEPLAVKSILMYLGFMGFSARSVQEGMSFMKDRFGEQIVDERINIYDDALHDETIGFPFDYEGVGKKRVDMIKDGIANEVVYDSYTAGKEEGRESTGHALPMPSAQSPMPMNMLMGAGSGDINEMIEDTEKGILVTRFNYCRPVHPVKSILTGLTRDGTWLIEDGEVTRPLKNLRFTQNLLEALSSVKSIGKERELFSLGYYPAYVVTPALHLSEFNFTGATEF